MNILIKRQILVAGFRSLVFATAMLTVPVAHAEGTLKGGLQIIHGQLYDANGRERGDATLSNALSLVKMEGINIIMPDELGKIRIGDLRLQDAPGDLIVRALSEASGNKFEVKEVHSEIGPGQPLLILETNRPPGPPPSDMQVQAFNITGYIEHRTSEVLNQHTENPSERDSRVEHDLAKVGDMIRDVAEAQQSLRYPQGGTAGPVSLPTIKFYKDANLLIVIGSPEAVETAAKIVHALPGEDPFSAGNYGVTTGNQIMQVIPGQNRTLLKQMGVRSTNSP